MLKLTKALVKKGKKELALKVAKAFNDYDDMYEPEQIKDATYYAIGELSDYLTDHKINVDINELAILMDQLGGGNVRFIISDEDGHEYGSVDTELEVVEYDYTMDGDPRFTYQFVYPKVRQKFVDKTLKRALINFLKTQSFTVEYAKNDDLKGWIKDLVKSGEKFLNKMIKTLSKYTKKKKF